jgi:hypothetical protein
LFQKIQPQCQVSQYGTTQFVVVPGLEVELFHAPEAVQKVAGHRDDCGSILETADEGPQSFVGYLALLDGALYVHMQYLVFVGRQGEEQQPSIQQPTEDGRGFGWCTIGSQFGPRQKVVAR